MHLTIGLDISTSCTGICALDERGSLVSLTHIKYPSKLSLWEKADLTRSELKKLIAQTDGTFKRFFVEESLQKFRPGLSSAKTLTTLSKFNGIVSYLGREVFKIDPEAINVNAARKSVGLKIPRGSNAKEVVLEWVSQEMNFHWPTKILKSGPRKGQEVLIDPCYDMADAYLIARAGQTFVNQVK
jgi:hypothetical protein|tara:strand:+ start:1496 stop:2050 length:555 start_codon:yes stop_codon:yes gene_type:complete